MFNRIRDYVPPVTPLTRLFALGNLLKKATGPYQLKHNSDVATILGTTEARVIGVSLAPSQEGANEDITFAVVSADPRVVSKKPAWASHKDFVEG